MRSDSLILRLGKAALCLVIFAACGSAQQVVDPCHDSGLGSPVLLYDANTRTPVITFESYVHTVPRDAYGWLFPDSRPTGTPHPYPTFLCDGRPAKVWIANRRLKQAFSVTTTAVFALPGGLPELRGLPSAPAAAPAAAPTPTAKGGLPPSAALTTDAVVGYLLNEETFDLPLQQLRDHAATVVEQHRFLAGLFDQYEGTLQSLTGKTPPPPAPPVPRTLPPVSVPPPAPPAHVPLPPGALFSGGPPPVPGVPVQGVATLTDAAANFTTLTKAIQDRFPIPITSLPTPPDYREHAESDFDQLTGQINQIVADLSRVKATLQSYPVVDVLVNLRSQVDAYEDSMRVLDHEYQNMEAAVKILQTLRQLASGGKADMNEYLRQRNAAEIRVLLTPRYGGSAAPVLDAATIARIVDLYIRSRIYITGSSNTDLDKRLTTLQLDLNTLLVSAQATLHMPSLSASDPFQDRLLAAQNGLQQLGNLIDDLNAAEAKTFAAINAVYDTYRAPLLPLNIDLQGNSGNLIVYYSIKGTEQFQRYQIAIEVQQPQSACVQGLAAGTGAGAGTPACTTAASAAAPPAAAAPTAAPTTATPATTAAATPPANPPADFYGSFEVHHFVRGALVTGFAYDSISNRSYSWVACPSSSTVQGACTTPASASSASPAQTTYQLVQSNSPQAAVVVGVNLFIKREDMFPGEKPPWWQSYLPTEPFLGASVYPLNHYFVGGSLEPIHGFFLTLGPVFGSQTSLPKNYQYAPGQQVTETSPPTIPSSSRFRKGAFIMAGFDTSLFKAIFGSLWSNVTSVGTPPAASTASK